MNPLRALAEKGQAVWLDFLSRDIIADGELKRLIDEDGLAGITSNPSIFEKAIGESASYDADIARLVGKGETSLGAIYERIATADIAAAADMLRPLYDKTEGRDGFVSLEVSPYLAVDTAATIEEARRLWQTVGRENIFIKVPATAAGIPAIRQLLAEGINVNITLLFSQQVYEEVVEAFFAGLEDRVAAGKPIGRMASVASFFVSRIDTAVDKLIDQAIEQSANAAERAALEKLRGKTAIANAKLAYQRWQKRFSGARWERLQKQGARPQQLLWASTGTKNPAYSDVLYIEELIGPETVNTMPEKTMDAFRDHGKVRDTLTADVGAAAQTLAALDRAGISLEKVTAELVADGVRLFADAFDKLNAALAGKRKRVLGKALNEQTMTLPEPLLTEVGKAAKAWRSQGNIRRLWNEEAALWTGGDEGDWLGWLDVVDAQLHDLPRFTEFAGEVRAQGYRDVLLLGMGGSSLGPEVLAQSLGSAPGFPKLHVLDSTDPQQVKRFATGIDPARTLFIVSSKSGTTLEPNVLMDYFFAKAASALGGDDAGSALCRRHRSGLEAGENRRGKALPPRLPRHSQHRRPLLGAVAVRPGAARGNRPRRARVSRPCLRHGAFLRPGSAAAGESRRRAWPDHRRRRACRPRQGHHHRLAVDRLIRRLGGATARRIDRQARQGRDPDRRGAAGRSLGL